jgi:hypothetical protein
MINENNNNEQIINIINKMSILFLPKIIKINKEINENFFKGVIEFEQINNFICKITNNSENILSYDFAIKFANLLSKSVLEYLEIDNKEMFKYIKLEGFRDAIDYSLNEILPEAIYRPIVLGNILSFKDNVLDYILCETNKICY